MGTDQRCKLRETWIAWLAFCLLLSGPAAAQSCAPPSPWSEANARHRRPEAEVGACLKVNAWQTRNLDVPIRSAVAGIVAQCEVRGGELGPARSRR
jgi:hypothetical protein